MEELRFLTEDLALKAADQYGTPAYVYDEQSLLANADATLAFPNAYGLTVRYAMKASSNAAILKVFNRKGIHIDASSGHEAERAMKAGVGGVQISLSTQQLPTNFAELCSQGVTINACSLSQLERIGKELPGSEIGIRFNPGVGSGGTNKTNVGGPSSSFGIWHELLDEVNAIIEKYSLKVFRIHTHIGSGSDPSVWQKASHLSLNLVKAFPDVRVLNLGGGFKVGRMSDETTTDLQVVGAPVKEAFEAFAAETSRELRLEIEPGTWLLANTCALVTTVQDKTTTGADGYEFLKLDAGMTDLLRPSLYGSRHPLITVSREARGGSTDYVVVGHCCESGDLITTADGVADQLQARTMGVAEIGDLCVIEGVGAYCSSMPAKNYNSFPESPEIMVRTNGDLAEIRRRQTLDQILQNEVPFSA